MENLDFITAGTQNLLFVCQLGEEKCSPGHAYGPTARTHYLIHYVLSGCGTFCCADGVYPVKAGQGFLIFPEEETYYRASEETPWHYAWVGYCGEMAENLTQMAGLSTKNRIFTPKDPGSVWQTMQHMIDETRLLPLTQISAVGNFLRMISMIAPPAREAFGESAARKYSEKAQWYLEGRFDKNVSIQETADFVGLSRSQLYRVMVQETGCSPKKMLVEIRVRNARRLLATTLLSQEAIAHRIGLQTGAQFAALFRSATGMTPGQYRKMYAENRKTPEG